ncbi:hypothetical protein AAG570_012538 [Ranatra chinensis]|uniref:Uncharacterized protein n=1 Tax=Ranatra chinensis TaxID=642074 RepID=A0ABD0Z0D9_9HEMI
MRGTHQQKYKKTLEAKKSWRFTPSPEQDSSSGHTPGRRYTKLQYGSHETGTNSHHCHQHRHRIHITHVIQDRPQPTRLVSEDDDTFLRFCWDEKHTCCHYLSFCYC